MPFQVPQYIGIEDKVIGPLSFRQFLYLSGGSGAAFLAYRFLPLYIGIFVIIPCLVLALSLAFYRINNRSFLTMVEHATRYFVKPKLYVWHHRERLEKKKKDKTIDSNAFVLPHLSESKLKDLSWSLDVVSPTQQEAAGLVRTLDGRVISVPPPPPTAS